MKLSDIGVYGLGVMGRNLALNLEDKGFGVSLYNRMIPGKEEAVVHRFMTEEGAGKNFIAADTVKEFVESVNKPRRILMMVKAGAPVDEVISELVRHLDKGDILIDGGNSYYRDTQRRIKDLEKDAITFIGMGVSGGAEGARNGPSLMPGGDPSVWPVLKTMLESIAAQTEDGSPCCTWIGEDGAGHFVKMVHNGIEYADMELIAEAAHLMKTGMGLTNEKISDVFSEWNAGSLNGYLMEITADIFRIHDKEGIPVVDRILDVAGQKGTGRWNTEISMNLGVPLPVATAAVISRLSSDYKALRIRLSTQLDGPDPILSRSQDEIIHSIESALLASRIVAYSEGFYLIREAAKLYEWHLNPIHIAGIWRGGCIIRSALLRTIMEAFRDLPDGGHLFESTRIQRLLSDNQEPWRQLVSDAIRHGIPIPGLSTALTQYDVLRSGRLPHYLIQAQRDYFGAHGYERVDKPRGSFFHSDWQHLLKLSK